MTRITLTSIPLLIALVIAGCGEHAAPVKRYPMQGVIKGLDTKAKSATIDAGKIGDWMEAMTMEVPVQPDQELSKIKPGDRIEATVVVSDVKYYVTGIKVTARPEQ